MDRRNSFIQQQGVDAPPESCSVAYGALMVQPRIVGVIVVTGAVLQSSVVFIALAALLWWNALLPRWNPFDFLANRFSRGYRLQPAPPPRRFAQALAGLMSAMIAGLLMAGLRGAAIAVEFVLLAAIAALVFGSFCLGSYLFNRFIARQAPRSAAPSPAQTARS